MDLLIDGQALQGEGKWRGIGRYSRELLDGIVRARPDWRVRVAASDHLGDVDVPESVEVVRYTPPVPLTFNVGPTTEYLRLHYADWLCAQKADAVLILSVFEGGGIPVRFVESAAATVAVFYDLIPLLFTPGYLYGHPDVWKYYARQLRETMSVDTLLAISDTSRRELQDLIPCRGPIVNIGGAPASTLAVAPAGEAEKKVAWLFARVGLPAKAARQFMLYVGGADLRKNLPALFRALALLPEAVRHEHPLVIAGALCPIMRGWLVELVNHLGLSSSVHFCGYVNDEELGALYQTTRLFVFPSLYEGLGLPVLEAMTYGTNVVASGTSSIPEFSAPGTPFFDPMNLEDMARQIFSALMLPERTDAAVKQAFAATFTWDKTADAACRAIEEAVSRPRPRATRGVVAWSRTFDEATAANALTEFCDTYAERGPTGMVLVAHPCDGEFPAAVTAAMRSASPDELDKMDELDPISARVYEAATPDEYQRIVGELVRRPGLLILSRELAQSPLLGEGHFWRGVFASDAILIRGLRPGEKIPARFKHLQYVDRLEGNFAAALAAVEEVGMALSRRWRNAVVSALRAVPDVSHPELRDWAIMRLNSNIVTRLPGAKEITQDGRKMLQVPQKLLKLVGGGGKQLWLGTNPPFDFESVALARCTNFRAPAAFHQKFDVVWCYEQPVCGYRLDQHLLLLDELIRFVGRKGLLVLRFSMQFGGLSVKHTLGRRPGVRAKILHEEEDAGGFIVSVIEIERLDIEKYQPAPWTFGVLTQNTRKANVVALLKSIRENDPAGEHEIIICGPEDGEYAFAAPRYLPQTYSKDLPEISRKKNDIAKAATHPNLLLVHDRYRLDDNFFVGFTQYGYDFDFLTVAQHFEDGDEYPAYCHLADDFLHMTTPSAASDFNSLRGTSFINGGLMIVKTHTARQLPLNELCFWNQAEDVELSATFIRNGLAPRFNPYSSATTLGIDKSHVAVYLTAGPSGPAPGPTTPSVKWQWADAPPPAAATPAAPRRKGWARFLPARRSAAASFALGILLLPAGGLFRLLGR